MTEIIGDKERGFDFTETIKPEVIETPTYDYGRSQEPLDYQLLKNKPSVGGGKIKNGQTSISGIGTLSITGLGFKPKYIEFESVGGQSMCISKTDGIYTNGIRMYNYDNITRYNTSNRAIELYNQVGEGYTSVDLTSIDSNGFTLNKTRVDFSTTLKWTAFG